MTSLIDLYAERSCSNSLVARGAKPIEDMHPNVTRQFSVGNNYYQLKTNSRTRLIPKPVRSEVLPLRRPSL
jgi:hypothetical protein